MSDHHQEAQALLRRALELFNDHPNFGLRNDAAVTSYKLAAKIEKHFADHEKVVPSGLPGHATHCPCMECWKHKSGAQT